MKLTKEEIFTSKEALRGLVDRDDIAVKYHFPIIQLAKRLMNDLAAIDDKRNSLIKKYGTEEDGQIQVKMEIEKKDSRDKVIMDKDKKPVMEPNPAFANFVTEFNELMQIEVEVVGDKLKIPDDIKVNGLLALEPLIEIIEIK